MVVYLPNVTEVPSSWAYLYVSIELYTEERLYACRFYNKYLDAGDAYTMYFRLEVDHTICYKPTL